MKKLSLLFLALASFVSVSTANAATITETFAAHPLQSGWQIFGDTNLFHWDSTNQNLQVTWDSSRTNSYFHQPLGTILARDDDFSIEFDLRLNDIASNTEPGKTGPSQIAIGFQNLAGASSTNFKRGYYGSAFNVVEFNYFTSGYYEFGGIFPVNPTTTPAFISSGGFSFAPTVFTPYEVEIPTNLWVRVVMNYTASNQTMTASLSTNGLLMAQLPDLVLTNSGTSGFTATDDFRVDTFSIISYSSFGNDFDSVLAHGVVDNVVVTVPPPPVQYLTGAFSNGVWQVHFENRTNWIYTLERTGDFQSWTVASEATAGNGGTLTLPATNLISSEAFFRVRANRP
ncbi:MAG: hypothetical protein H7Y43_04825 [Akkermansiaceae bacterium]|nr:hypothetical protein [Verrucomicrobiales bacterium]